MNGSIVFIGLGSNLGDRERNLNQAIEQIRLLPQTQLLALSRTHETDPVGGPPQGKFLNAAAKLETQLKPFDLLHRLQEIERRLGRPAVHERWGPRVIDLDILTYDDLTMETPELTLPHPLMREREFVMKPLKDL